MESSSTPETRSSLFAASPTARSGPALGTTITSRSSSSATSPRWRKTGSTRSASTRLLPAGSSTSALEHGLRVMVGLPWEQHVAFLDDRGLAPSIEDELRARCPSVRRPPRRSVLRRRERDPGADRPLARRGAGSSASSSSCTRPRRTRIPDALVTYVNYPSTEYLHLPFLDLVCFNVFLEAERAARCLPRPAPEPRRRPPAAPRRDRPGQPPTRRGARRRPALGWQIRASFAAGAPARSSSRWTDEWHRGGYDIEDWDFGLVDRTRDAEARARGRPRGVRRRPVSESTSTWPRISVVVCTLQRRRARSATASTALADSTTPTTRCIVVDDGSTDDTAAIAAEFDFRVISTENDGSRRALATPAWTAATGEIVAYIDDDA